MSFQSETSVLKLLLRSVDGLLVIGEVFGSLDVTFKEKCDFHNCKVSGL